MSRELAWYDGTRRRLSHWDRIRGAKLEQLLLLFQIADESDEESFSLQDPSSMFQTGFYLITSLM